MWRVADDKPLTPDEAERMYGPIGVAAALKQVKQGHTGSLRVRAYISQVKVDAEGDDTLAGHRTRLIKVRRDRGLWEAGSSHVGYYASSC